MNIDEKMCVCVCVCVSFMTTFVSRSVYLKLIQNMDRVIEIHFHFKAIPLRKAGNAFGLGFFDFSSGILIDVYAYKKLYCLHRIFQLIFIQR